MHVTKIVQAAVLLAVGARASSAPASQDSSLEPRGVAADMFKFNWHIPKVPTWKELNEPTPRNKKIKESQDEQVAAAKAAAAAAAEGKKTSGAKKPTRRSIETDEKSRQEEGVEVKRGVAWSA
ncbi:hypothetical protein RB594_001085 [Gaeumannomyces avenae]